MKESKKNEWLKPYTVEEEIIKTINLNVKKYKLDCVRALRGRVMAVPIPVWPISTMGTPIVYKEVMKDNVGTGKFYITSDSGVIICGENTMSKDHIPSPKDLEERFSFLDFPENPYKFYVITSDNENVANGSILYIRPDTIMNKIKPVNINGFPVFFLDPEWFMYVKLLK